MEIAQQSDRVFKLKTRLQSATHFSFLYPCRLPPSFNLLTMNAMAAAHSVLVPLQCEFFALEGLSQLLETVDQVRRSVNPQLDIQGIVLTMFDSRNIWRAAMNDGAAPISGKRFIIRCSAQRARVRGALLWEACHSLRPQMCWKSGLSAVGFRSHSARTPASGCLSKALEYSGEYRR